jgi:hypothetical protein
MKRYVQLFIILVVSALVILAGCDLDGGDDGGDTDDALAVGDASPDVSGYTVSYVDEAGGYFAEKDDDATQVLVWGRFETDIKFTADKTWILGNAVFIGNNAQDPANAAGNTLTIEAGTTIKGEVDDETPGVLIITRGSKIDAQGTATNPITFTSLNPAGERAAGDWGGLILNGYARVQGGYAEGEGGTGQYGGGDSPADNDNSGTIKYVVVQFAGTLFSPDNELNGIVFQGVGSGTTVDHIQVHRNADDGIEFFGGSVQVKYYVGTGNQDDTLDGDDGWNGSVQHAILQTYDDDAGSLIEADGDAEDVFPAASAYLANITGVGSSASSSGFTFKSAGNYTMYNSVVDMQEADSQPAVQELDGSTISYNGVVAYGGDYTDTTELTDSGSPSGIQAGVATLSSGTWSFDFDNQPNDGTAVSVPSEDPAGNSLDDTDYIGAYDGSDAWWDGWTSFPAN